MPATAIRAIASSAVSGRSRIRLCEAWVGQSASLSGEIVWVLMPVLLLVAECVDGPQRRGTVCGVEPEEHAARDRDPEREDDRVRRDHRVDAVDPEAAADQSCRDP